MMSTLVPKMLILGYHDGETDGFLNGMNDSQVYFFKVVAWDRGQDRRLFLLVQVEQAVYVELLEVLAASGQVPTGSIWAPSWKFNDADREARADKLVHNARRALKTGTVLVLGEDLTRKFEILRPNGAELARAIAMAEAQAPGSLEDWLAERA